MGEEIPFDVNVIGNREDYVWKKCKLSLIAKISNPFLSFFLFFFYEDIPKISIWIFLKKKKGRIKYQA